MWSTSKKPQFDDGKSGSGNLYGVHPFVLVETKTPGQYIGIYFRNSNAQSPVIKYKDNEESTLSYITTGGQLDMYIML